MGGINLGALAGGLAAGIEVGSRLKSQRERDELAKEEMGLRRRKADREEQDYQDRKAAWEGIANDMLEATSQTQRAVNDGGAGLERVSQPDLPEEGASWSQGLQPRARTGNIGQAAGYAVFTQPAPYWGNPEFLNKSAERLMRVGDKDGVQFLKNGYEAHQKGLFQALALAANGDYSGAEQALNARGAQVVPGSIKPVEGKPGFIAYQTPDGRSQEVDPGAMITTLTDPLKYMTEMDRRRDDKRKQAESEATIKLRGSQSRQAEAQANFIEGARTDAERQRGNAAVTRAERAAQPRDSKESIDRAHQSSDAQIGRLSVAIDKGGRQLVDPETRKPVIDQGKQNKLYQLYNDAQLEVENLLGRDLAAREIRLLGQRMSTAPLDDDAKRPAWMRDTVRAIVGRPAASGNQGRQGAPAGGSRGQTQAPQRDNTQPPGPPPVEGATWGSAPDGQQGWFLRDENGRVAFSPASPTAAPAATRAPSAQQAPTAPAPSQSPDAVLKSVSVRDQSAAQQFEQANPRLRRLGDALRLASSGRGTAMQSEAAQLYQAYYAELQRTLGAGGAAAQDAVPIRAPVSVAGLERRAQ